MPKKMRAMVDTCCWVDFFRSGKGRTSQSVNELVMNDNACVSGIIISELVYGAISKKEADLIKNVLFGVHVMPIDNSILMKAGDMGFYLRRKGFTIPLTDLVIAVQCLENNLELMTSDKHFNIIAEHTPLKAHGN